MGEVELFGEETNEPVHVVDADPDWSNRYEELRGRLEAALGPQFRVEHVGSTAVAGLAAKPVIDVQVSVPDLTDEAAYRAAIESTGVVLRAREPGHRFFRTPAGAERRLHVLFGQNYELHDALSTKQDLVWSELLTPHRAVSSDQCNTLSSREDVGSMREVADDQAAVASD